MSDPTAAVPAEGAAATESTTEQPGGADFSPVVDRVNELATNFEGFQGEFQRFMQSQQPAPAAEPNPWESLFGEPEPDPNAVDQFGNQVQPQQPPLDAQALQTAFQQALQQANAPLMAQIQEMQHERAVQQLGQMIPQLANTPENRETIEQTDTLVRQSIAHMPPQLQQALLMDPHYVATVFKAAEAEKLAQGQAPAGGQVPTLEAAGGAHPGGDGEPVNPVHQIYAASRAELPRGFSR